MRAVAAAVALLAVAGLAAGASAAPLRIAVITSATEPCRALERSAPAGERAYYAHLAKRLEVEVQKCRFADAGAAAAALAAGTVDMSLLDPASYAPIKDQARAILTLRMDGALNRIPVNVGVRADDPRRRLGDLKGAKIAYGGRAPAALGVPKSVLAERGAGEGFFGQELVESDEHAAIASLRARRVDAMALNAAAWQRLCRPVAPNKPSPCADLKVVLRARPQASRALVVRRDLPDETRYRLIGIHMPLHMEAPAAFAWAAAWMPKAAEFVPTEAEALTLANIR